MHKIQPPIPIPRPTMIAQPSPLRPTLVQDILKRVPADLLRVATRPRQVPAVRRVVIAVVLPLVRVAAHVLARGVQRVARRGAHGAEAVAGAFGGKEGGCGEEGEEEGGSGEMHCGSWGVAGCGSGGVGCRLWWAETRADSGILIGKCCASS
jgi:hypothetical protein